MNALGPPAHLIGKILGRCKYILVHLIQCKYTHKLYSLPHVLPRIYWRMLRVCVMWWKAALRFGPLNTRSCRQGLRQTRLGGTTRCKRLGNVSMTSNLRRNVYHLVSMATVVISLWRWERRIRMLRWMWRLRVARWGLLLSVWSTQTWRTLRGPDMRGDYPRSCHVISHC